MNSEELLARIYALAPDIAQALSVERVIYKKSESKAYFIFLSQKIVGEKGYLAIKKAVGEAFPGLKYSVRVASPALAEDFLDAPDKYAHVFGAMLVRAHPAIAAWEFDINWVNEGGKIYIETPDEFSLNYMKENGVREQMEAAVYDVFRLKTEIYLRVRGDHEKRLREIMEKRLEDEKLEKKLALASASVEKAPVKPVAKPEKPVKLIGRSIVDKPVPIGELGENAGTVVVAGKVLSQIAKDTKTGDSLILTFDLTDYSGSIRCKTFLNYRGKRSKDGETLPPVTPEQRAAVQEIVDLVKPGSGVMARGEYRYDDFSHGMIIMLKDVMRCELKGREDNAPEKRVELHLHTQMSNMDAVSSPQALIERAAKFGHPAVAITDHGVVQAFPDAFAAAKKSKIKLIPGVEGYLTEKDVIVKACGERPLDTPIVVVDFETTGLNTRSDRIIEIGAVKIENGRITDEMSQFVDPETILPEKITQITHITDQMLLGAPKAREALPRLMEFIGGAVIAAHNASFDCAVLRSELKRMDRDCPEESLDTLAFARRLYPELKSHRLSAVCKRLGVSLKNAHRAVHDAKATAQCLIEMLSQARAKGAETLSDLDSVATGFSPGGSYHIILLAATQKGMFNLNKLISLSHLTYFRRHPNMPREEIQKYREGLIVGSACEAGELFSAVVAGESEDKLLKRARFYDYLEIQPVGNNEFLIRDGRADDEEQLREFNRVIVRLGEKLGVPVCATGDVHFLDPQDAVFRTILQAGQGYEDCDEQPPLYFKTTEEMLKEFAYLGDDKAREVVIDNPRMIADRVENVSLFPKHPEGKTTFSPLWESAADDIQSMSWARAKEMYGDPLPDIVRLRLEKELKSIIGYGYATLYSIANKLVTKSLSDGYLVGSRGSVGSSLVATMCGITEVNALAPHYLCGKCQFYDFDVPKEYTVGVDLPDRVCPRCGSPLQKEGYDIPFEVFLGFKGDKVPDIDLNFSGEYQPRAHAYVEELFGKGYVFRAGTIGTLAEKTAYGYVLKYLEERNMTVPDAEKTRLAAGCVGVKRTTGQHPGGMVVLPKEYDICQFTAVQHPADDLECGITTTHYDFSSMHDVLVKLDILGHDDPTMMHMLEELTGVGFKKIPLDDKKVMSLFLSPAALGVTSQQIMCNTGTYGVPEFGTSFVRQMLEDTKPTTMEELIRISGLSHGTDVWLGNAKDLITSHTATLKKCICTRDDIMNALIEYGVDTKTAFDTMESVRKGKGLKPEMESAMNEHNVPSWFIDSCKKIKYMFPKGHAVAYVTMSLRVAWYKVNHPLAYYAAYFTIRGDGFDSARMLLPYDKLREMLESYYEMDSQKLSGKEKDEITALEIALEMNARGIRFLKADLYKSDLKRFLIEDGALRVPFTSIGGLGESAAQGIIDSRAEQPFLSIEDLKKRARLSSAVIELLQAQGCLDGLSETSQVTLFQMM